MNELDLGRGENSTLWAVGDYSKRSMAHQLVDELLLMVYPVVLGSGRRLFTGDTYVELDLLDAKVTRTGVMIATYCASQSPLEGHP